MIRGITVAVMAVATVSCGDDGPTAPLTLAQRSVVNIAAQTCMDPNAHRGIGVVVTATDGTAVVVTAGHVVEGDLRELIVDARPATVLAIDRNADLAVIDVDGLDEPPLALSAIEPAGLIQMSPASATGVDVTDRERLVVEHLSDHETYRRDVIAFTPPVVGGMSGSPLVDGQGRIAGVVILNDDATGEGIAVTADHVRALLDTVSNEAREAGDRPGTC